MKKLILALFGLLLFSNNLVCMTLEPEEIPNLATKLMNGEVSTKDLAVYDIDSLIELNKYISTHPRSTKTYNLLNNRSMLSLRKDPNATIEFGKILPRKVLDLDFQNDINSTIILEKSRAKYSFSIDNSTDISEIKIKNNESGTEFTLDKDLSDKYKIIYHFTSSDLLLLFSNEHPDIKIIDLNNQSQFTLTIKDNNLLNVRMYISDHRVLLMAIHDKGNYRDIFDIQSILEIEEIIKQKEQELFAQQIVTLLGSHPKNLFKRKL
jgi:hypothetical protein